MYSRLLASLIFLLPFLFPLHPKEILFVSADCPACYYRLEKLKEEGRFPRLFAIDQSLEVNCLLKKLYQIDPKSQEPFLLLLHSKPKKIALTPFCLEMQIDKNELLECKNCSLYQLSVNEILYYVMSKFISIIPYGS
ncbi:MAG: hypothetical protein EBZ47_09645 [Chlamydiae bacterium]|jgi:hypothetical protein|nr:hypothetical protein [Chlamydiota bacterium]NDD98955.1 hypothetical protein [bacterium]